MSRPASPPSIQMAPPPIPVAAAGFTFLFGRLADFFGRRRLFLAGMVLLSGASLLGGFATNPEMLLTVSTHTVPRC